MSIGNGVSNLIAQIINNQTDGMNRSICNNFIQRTEYAITVNRDPGRFDPLSPYLHYSKAALDMRRKARTLEHLNNALTVQSTKASSFARLVNRRNGRAQKNCSKNELIYVPTSSSDVPGPVIMLYNNINTPLYNFQPIINQSNRINGVDVNDRKIDWHPLPIIDSQFEQNTPNILANLTIFSPEHRKYSFDMNSTIAILLEANKTRPAGVSTIRTQIISVSLLAYYSNVLMYQQNNIPFTFSDLSVSVAASALGNFSAGKFVGNLKLNNVLLNVCNEYTFTFKLEFKFNYTEYDANGVVVQESQSNINNIHLSAIANLSGIEDPYYYQFSNAKIINPPPRQSILDTFSLSGFPA